MASAKVPLCGEQLRSSLCWPETGNMLRLVTLRGVVTSQHNICGRSATSDSARWWKGSYSSVFVWVWTSTGRIFQLSNMLYSPASLSPSLSAVPRVCCWCVFVPRAHSLSASFNSPPTIYHTRTETRTQTPMWMHFFLFHFNLSSHTHRHTDWIFKPRGSTPSHWVSRVMSFLFC